MSCFCASTHTHTFKHGKNDRLSRCFLRLRSHIILTQHELYLAHYSVFILKIQNATSLEHGEREFPANYRFFLQWFYFLHNANTTAVERKKKVVMFNCLLMPLTSGKNQHFVQWHNSHKHVHVYILSRLFHWRHHHQHVYQPNSIPFPSSTDVLCVRSRYFLRYFFFGLPSILSIVCLFFRASH